MGTITFETKKKQARIITEHIHAVRFFLDLKIEPDIWKEAKKHAIDKDMELSEYIESLIKKDLKKN